MSDRTGIEWTDATWNPLRGCSSVSEGCRNCYAERVAARFSGPGQPYERLAATALDHPLHWRKPRRICVNSMSDLFHQDVSDEWIDRVFAAMALAPQHQFQVLTKRPGRMLEYIARRDDQGRVPALDYAVLIAVTGQYTTPAIDLRCGWPLPNVWLGTSVKDQPTADARIPHLLATPAAVRFVSAEPLLGPVDLTAYMFGAHQTEETDWCARRLDWLIVGGESGPGARPMHPDWARSLRDQCAAASVPFFMKQMAREAPIPDDLMVRKFPDAR